MTLPKSTVQSEAPTDITARKAARIARKARPGEPTTPAPTPFAEMTEAEFLATDVPGEQVIAIRIRDGEPPAYRAFGGLTWALFRAHLSDLNHDLENQTLQGLIAAETRVANMLNAAQVLAPPAAAQ